MKNESLGSGAQVHRLRYEGKLYGYRQATRKMFWTKANQAYAQWKKDLRLMADVSLWPQDLGSRCRATLYLKIFWSRRARIDRKNIEGAVEDALFTRDRRILDAYVTSYEFSGWEGFEVQLEIQEDL